ncbi:MAG: glycosyltransferase family 4 protein [Pseudomonadales bacterium]|nr:glycosyltransferase family 4 protein [Pseudomonadales bacterium]
MNVLYHHRTRASGAEGVHILGIQNALKELGFSITDVSMLKPQETSQESQVISKDQPHNALANKGLKHKILHTIASNLPNIFFKLLEIAYNLRTHLVTSKALKCAARKSELPDFIYERYGYFGFAVSRLAKRYKVPLVLEVNTTCLDYDVREIRFRWLAKIIERYVFNNARLLVVVSNYLRDKIKTEYGISEDRIIVTPNAIEPSRFTAVEQFPDDLVLQMAREFVSGKTVIGFVGIFAPWHGLDLLLDVYCDLAKKMAKEQLPVLLLVGDGPMREHIDQRIRDAGLTDNVHITGKVPHLLVKYYLELFDIGTMPDSNPFGSPMKVIEYMAMGKAIVAPSYGPIEEIIESDRNGLLFPPKDQQSFLKQIERFLEKPELRQQFGEVAKTQALTQHTWRSNVEKILAQADIKY